MGERASIDHTLTYVDFLKLFGIYVVLHIIRLVMILICYPLLSKIGYKLNFN